MDTPCMGEPDPSAAGAYDLIPEANTVLPKKILRRKTWWGMDYEVWLRVLNFFRYVK